jgi:hypothetical protein
MSNLVSAKAAIRAEIAHAKKGAAYYQSLVQALEEALSRLDRVNDAPMPVKKAGRKSVASVIDAAMEMPKKRGRKPGSKNKKTGAGLPSTGKNFWPDMMTDEPQSAAEVLQAAAEKLGIDKTPDQMKKLTQRATFALNDLVKKGIIADSGSGRGRRFLRKQ